MANIYKRNDEFEKSIKYYSLVLEKLNKKSDFYADVLHKRGAAHERLGDNNNSDKDLLESLSIKPDEPYVLNYLGYSWLERGYKIQEAINMLDKAYNKKKNDPYIIDSVGWGYYLIGNFVNAEIFLRKAIQLMPNDPIVNDHYGDVLWKLNRKIEAKYYWQSAINSEKSENEMKTIISKKLLKGLEEG
jgi:tetratricopeptide (TPR) repeat protein